MIREMRNKHKLEQYYRKYIGQGEIDPNVHPWVAESWQRSRNAGVPNNSMPKFHKLTAEQLLERQNQHKATLDYVCGQYQEIRDFFHSHSLSLLLLDKDCYVLNSYATPFFQRTPEEIAGARLTDADIGTSSICIAARHKVPFMLFEPETWITECQNGDACATPILATGEMRYILSIVSVERETIHYSAVVALMLGMKYALENYLTMRERLTAQEAILDAAPFAAYHVLSDSRITYANRLGASRLPIQTEEKQLYFEEVLLNYRHTPIYKGLAGATFRNAEVTWTTADKTYEDITTVVPLKSQADNTITGAAIISLPIDDLGTLMAHAVSYPDRHSFSGLVGSEPVFVAVKDKLARLARGTHHILLQGEAGTGKERFAYAIHRISGRSAEPFIVIKCSELPADMIEAELFGTDGQPGKVELAKGGTLFLNEIERLPIPIAERLAGLSVRTDEAEAGNMSAVRLVATCDSDLKRLSEKELFSVALYEIFSKDIIRIPALRQRTGDIPALVEHIIKELAEDNNMAIKKVSTEAMELMLTYEWPGNIKQLRSVVEQAFFGSTIEWILPEDIQLMDEPVPGSDWKGNRASFIKEWKAVGGNISRLAHNLNVSRATLYRYLKKYGLTENG